MATTASRRRIRHLRLWLRLHAATERRLARAVAQFFRQQGARILARLHGHGTITPVDVANAIDWPAESERFIRTVARPLLMAAMVTGATVALQTLTGKSSDWVTKSARDDDDSADEFEDNVTLPFQELPAHVRDRILHTLDRAFRQNYWEKIQDDQRDAIQGAIREALDSGEYGEGPLSKVIRDVTDGDVSRTRAATIARTECGGALNAGHAAAMEQLEQAGAVTGREWITVGDKDVRETHAELNGTQVGAGEDFEVGDGHAPFPGHWSLPPEERVNCRCTILAVGLDEGNEEREGND
jgi:uncharacterized protein with gpF-like domain